MLASTDGNCVNAFTAGSQVLKIYCLQQSIAGEAAVLLKPAGSGGNLVRKGRTGKHLSYQCVRIQRDGPNHLLQLFRGQRCTLPGIATWRRFLSSNSKRRCGNDQQKGQRC